MKVWVDLVNSPQVLVLTPIIRELERRGHEVLITTRDFAQTVELADRAGLTHVALGQHGGSSRRRSIQLNLQRVAALINLVWGKGIGLALSHNSYSQALAAKALGIPLVTMMDYEHQRANHVAFRLARRVIVPEYFPDTALRRYGALSKAVKFPGIKEHLYLADFTPDPDFARECSLPKDRVIVVARPPGYWGLYYKGTGELFEGFLQEVRRRDDVFLVFLPRVAEQKALVNDLPADRLLVPARALDGPNLLSHADLAVSGGGTMNREAAVLNTPAYTLFEGEIGGVDRFLANDGRLTIVSSFADLGRIRFEKKRFRRNGTVPSQSDLVRFVTDAALAG